MMRRYLWGRNGAPDVSQWAVASTWRVCGVFFCLSLCCVRWKVVFSLLDRFELQCGKLRVLVFLILAVGICCVSRCEDNRAINKSILTS